MQFSVIPKTLRFWQSTYSKSELYKNIIIVDTVMVVQCRVDFNDAGLFTVIVKEVTRVMLSNLSFVNLVQDLTFLEILNKIRLTFKDTNNHCILSMPMIMGKIVKI